MTRMTKPLFALLSGLLLALASPVMAQTFPNKPIRIIVPFPPGGGNDVIWGNATANRITTGAGTDRVKYDLGANINGDTLADFSNVDLLDLSALRLTPNQQTQINWDASSNRLTYIDPAQAANSWSLTINGSFSTTQIVLA